MAVNRCICTGVTFESALAVARARGLRRVVDLRSASPLGSGCGLCVPYMQQTLISGQTDLPVLDEPSRRRLLALSGIEEGGE